jgi:hypothetical protein
MSLLTAGRGISGVGVLADGFCVYVLARVTE